MKIKVRCMNALSDKRTFRDAKTGQEQVRPQLTIAAVADWGEMLNATLYGDFSDVPKQGNVVELDVYRYESVSPLMGSLSCRGFEIVK